MKILFVGDFRYNSGSSHTIYQYFLTAQRLGHEISVSSEYGSLDNEIPKFLPISSSTNYFDRVVFVFESNQYLTETQIGRIDSTIPRSSRFIIDPDGRSNKTVLIDNDTNHSAPYMPESWSHLFEKISDVVMQPSLSKPTNGVIQYLYYGFDHIPDRSPKKKDFDILYVGNNWYRWQDIMWLLKQLEPIRNRLGRIGIKGKWWDGVPKPGLEKHTYSNPSVLASHGIEVFKSVPFNYMIAAISDAVINPIFVRPMIGAQCLATPRMFETFGADTIPVLGRNVDYVSSLYGENWRTLYLKENIAEQICAICDNSSYYRSQAAKISNRLWEEHNYEKRLGQLIEILT